MSDADQLVKIEFYVPESHLETVKSAMFEAGAGKVGLYNNCAWQTAGEGQFRPLSGSRPFLGEQGTLETVVEYKVEMVCPRLLAQQVVAAMKEAHPYDEVAFSVLATEAF
jgi:hypothetical protein